MSRNVSITLQNNDDARPIIRAITTDNPHSVINEYPSMVKIDAPDALTINRERVEEYLGRDWDVQELHLTLISLAGEVDEDDEYFRLHWG